MTERITSIPAQFSVTCVQLPGQESELARSEMANTAGGCNLPGEDPNDLSDLYGDIIIESPYYMASIWWWDFH